MRALRTILASASVVAGVTMIAAVGSAAFAASNPNGSGQPATGQNPNISCGNYQTPPGNSVNAGGSAFNPSGTAGSVYAGSLGTASANNSNSPKSVSEYDIACYQQSSR
jgi:hypothetical protein